MPVFIFEVDPAEDRASTTSAPPRSNVRLVGSVRNGTSVRSNGVISASARRDEGEVSAVVVLRSLTPSRLLSYVRAMTSAEPGTDSGAVNGGTGRDQARSEPHRERHRTTSARLTSREIEVLRLLADGATTRTIAQQLSYSERTVKNVVHDLLDKLECRTRAHAVAEAARRGVI